MKLRNKITGEILEDVKFIDTSLNTIEIHYLDNGVLRMETEKDYHTFIQNWVDAEHKETMPKRWYLINKETGYICTCENEEEAFTIKQMLEDWEFININLNDIR